MSGSSSYAVGRQFIQAIQLMCKLNKCRAKWLGRPWQVGLYELPTTISQHTQKYSKPDKFWLCVLQWAHGHGIHPRSFPFIMAYTVCGQRKYM